MKKTLARCLKIILVACLLSILGCATQKASLEIEKSLPQNEIAYYNDAFDKLRNDLWDKAGLTFNPSQLADFKLADLNIEDGKLKIQTKIGHFSKGGLVSKYTLRGDFDIQIDCQIDFLDKTPGMDQVLLFLVKESKKPNFAMIGVSKREGRKALIWSWYFERGKPVSRKWRRRENFRGSLRIARIGNRIRSFYREEGKSEWEDLLNFQGMSGDVVIGFALQNFTGLRTSIQAETSIMAVFDNFKINAAQEIIEEEI